MAVPSLRGSPTTVADPIATASLDELRALQLARLKQAVAHAAQVPHHARQPRT